MHHHLHKWNLRHHQLPATKLLPILAWWRHQMETFSALLARCAKNSPITGEFHTQRPVKRSFDVSFDLRPNKRLCKQSWGWWFEMPSGSLWRHCNGNTCTEGRWYCILHFAFCDCIYTLYPRRNDPDPPPPKKEWGQIKFLGLMI